MPELRTTFIPQKPASTLTRTDAPPRTVNIVVLLGVVIFLGALAAAAGFYFYRAVLLRDIGTLSSSITRAEEIISPALVARLGEFDKRAGTVKTLLDNHIVLTPVFDLLSALAIGSVRFSKFEYVLGREGNAKMTLSGEARSYSALAAESDILGKSEHVKEPIFSNFELNPQGNVTFNFSAKINKGLQLYRNTLSPETAPASAPSVPTAPETTSGGASVPTPEESQ